MGRFLNVGNARFAAMVKDIYVDKTEMIKFMNGTIGKKRKLTCVSRPRRFGKSYAAQMLCAYYGKSCDSRTLFEGLAISKDPSLYDGYSFSREKSVYSPNSVMEAIVREEFGSYWTRTGTYESLKIYIDLDMDGLKEAVIRMLRGEKVKIRTGSFQSDMTTIESRDDILTLMVHLGCLAYESKEETVLIPNEEVSQEFILAIAKSKHKEMAARFDNACDSD